MSLRLPWVVTQSHHQCLLHGMSHSAMSLHGPRCVTQCHRHCWPTVYHPVSLAPCSPQRVTQCHCHCTAWSVTHHRCAGAPVPPRCHCAPPSSVIPRGAPWGQHSSPCPLGVGDMSPSLSPRLAPAAKREWQFPVTHRRALIKPRCWQPLIAARREGGGSRRVRNEGRGQGQGWMCQPRLRLQLGSRVGKGTVAQHWARSWPGGQAHPAAGQPASPWGHWPASGATGQLARRQASTQPTGQPPTSHLPATYQPAGQAARLRQLASRLPVTRPAGQPVLSAASKAISQRALTGRLPATSHRATRLARPPAGQLRSQAGHHAATGHWPLATSRPPKEPASRPGTSSALQPAALSPRVPHLLGGVSSGDTCSRLCQHQGHLPAASPRAPAAWGAPR